MTSWSSLTFVSVRGYVGLLQAKRTSRVCDGDSHALHVRFSEHDRSSSFSWAGASATSVLFQLVHMVKKYTTARCSVTECKRAQIVDDLGSLPLPSDHIAIRIAIKTRASIWFSGLQTLQARLTNHPVF